MNNIKTIEVIKPVFGLEIGDRLSRVNSGDNFEISSEVITDSYTKKKEVSISESCINKDEFKAVEWLNEKPLTNKEKISKLESENSILVDRVKALEEMLLNSSSMHMELNKKINKAIDDTQLKYDLAVNEFSGQFTYGDLLDVDSTIYLNILKVLKSIVDEQIH